jgi:hypothetical protein
LEQLPQEKQDAILDLAAHGSLADVLEGLHEEGVQIGMSSLKRFVREYREKNLLREAEGMKASVKTLAERGREGKLREGTLEAVRQRLYERALESQTAEEALAMYAAMVKEETRLKELELEARKVAALEQQVKLQGLRIEVQARQVKGMKAGEVVASAPAAVGELTQGEKGVEEERQRLEGMLREVDGIVNGAGYAEDKVLAVRARLAEAMRALGAG